jgi:uncharacterized protein
MPQVLSICLAESGFGTVRAMSKEPARIVVCPTCRKPTKWSPENRNRPFCSDRCRLIDLGEWASEGYRITGDRTVDDRFSEDDDNR